MSDAKSMLNNTEPHKATDLWQMGQSIEGKCIKQRVANDKNQLKSLQLKGTHTQHITISDVRDKKKVKPTQDHIQPVSAAQGQQHT
jgi:hypothetical protein